MNLSIAGIVVECLLSLFARHGKDGSDRVIGREKVPCRGVFVHL